MANEIIMPKLGVDMQEGEILEWKKAEGDKIEEGDILLEIMSDKTNMELEAEDSGVLLKILHPAGDVVAVTEVIGYIGAEGEKLPDSVGIEQANQPGQIPHDCHGAKVIGGIDPDHFMGGVVHFYVRRTDREILNLLPVRTDLLIVHFLDLPFKV